MIVVIGFRKEHIAARTNHIAVVLMETVARLPLPSENRFMILSRSLDIIPRKDFLAKNARILYHFKSS